jgi:hypothetical protein
MNNSIPADIQLLLDSRELTIRTPREQYKEQKKERQNYSSRLDRADVTGVKVSSETCLVAQRQASEPLAFASSKISLESVTSSPRSQGAEEGYVIAPRELTSRYSGISVQHVKTEKGVKVAITLQKPDWCAEGACQLATAELKRYDRMREVKARPDDSETFALYLANVKQQLRDSANHSVCIGRLHQRSRRSAWLYDTLMVAFLQGEIVERVMLYLEGEEYVIPLDHTLTDLQQKYYHNQGIHGAIAGANRAPRLDDLPLTRFGAQ